MCEGGSPALWAWLWPSPASEPCAHLWIEGLVTPVVHETHGLCILDATGRVPGSHSVKISAGVTCAGRGRGVGGGRTQFKASLGKTQCAQELLQEQVQSPSLKTSTGTPGLKSPKLPVHLGHPSGARTLPHHSWRGWHPVRRQALPQPSNSPLGLDLPHWAHIPQVDCRSQGCMASSYGVFGGSVFPYVLNRYN